MTDHSSPDLTNDPPPEGVDRRRFIQGVGAVAGAGALASQLPADLAHAAVPAGASVFESLPKAVRVLDTREAGAWGNNRIRLYLGGNFGIPEGVSAVVATVTAVNGNEANYVSVFPAGAGVPLVSNLNLSNPGDVNANLVTVKVGTGGSYKGAIELLRLRRCDVIVDVIGYYTPVLASARAGRFEALSIARRAIDTRQGGSRAANGSITEVHLPAVPSDASAAVINLTATECTGPGHFTVFPSAENAVPLASSLNVTSRGETRAVAVIVPVDSSGRVKVFTHTAAHLIVDVSGYFTGSSSASSSAGLFVPVDPVRVLDTRLPGQIGKMWPQWMVEGNVPGAGSSAASAIVVNLTGAESRAAGYFTMSAARQPIPETSNVNWTGPGAVVPNHVITPITATHGFQVFSSHGAHAVVDYAGYFTGAPKDPARAAYVNPPPPPIAPPWRLSIPRFGHNSWVLTGDPTSIVDAGHTWHWTGTGDMGQNANVATFAHRTSSGGPMRYLDSMQVGDLFYVTTGDNRQYTYKMVRRDLTDPVNANILNAVRAHPGTTMSLVACTVGYDSRKSRYPDAWAPTSLLYRIVVTGELVSWKEL